MLRESEALTQAEMQLRTVLDDTAGRIALLERTYRAPAGSGEPHLPYRRAAMSFMRWQADRGLLEAPNSQQPGSRWWRAINGRLLRDGCEGVALSNGCDGAPSTASVGLWLDFIANPDARCWYRAHNASIVAAYLDHRDLAEAENEPERFFMNVALLRVLYAHALVANPKLALGRFAKLGGLLGDPRLGMAGAFLSLGRVLPDRYPLDLDLNDYLSQEHGLGRLLDYAVISPKLQELYEWSATELGQPKLLDLIKTGSPAYVWPLEKSYVWQPRRPSRLGALLARATVTR